MTNLSARVVIEYYIKDVCDSDDLDNNYSFADLVAGMIAEEGILGLAEDNVEILSIEIASLSGSGS